MNINDYLIWRGDIPFSDSFPFNDVDGLISIVQSDKVRQLQRDIAIESINNKGSYFILSFIKNHPLQYMKWVFFLLFIYFFINFV